MKLLEAYPRGSIIPELLDHLDSRSIFIVSILHLTHDTPILPWIQILAHPPWVKGGRTCYIIKTLSKSRKYFVNIW